MGFGFGVPGSEVGCLNTRPEPEPEPETLKGESLSLALASRLASNPEHGKENLCVHKAASSSGKG